MGDREYTKGERLAELYRRLDAAPVSRTFDEAYRLVCDTLNSVEDDMTSVPFAPENWMVDGRMYPPQMDHSYPVKGRPGFTRLRSKGHNTIIGVDGTIEVRTGAGELIYSRPGGGASD